MYFTDRYLILEDLKSFKLMKQINIEMNVFDIDTELHSNRYACIFTKTEKNNTSIEPNWLV
jgi:hypothetical protein